MKITFAKADDSGTGYYRMQQPAAMLSRYHEVYCGCYKLDNRLLYESDIVVLQRQHDITWLDIMEHGRQRGCKYVYELDDNMFALPKGYAHSEQINPKLATASALLRQSDAVLTSTVPLAEVLREYNKNVITLTNFVIEPINEIPEAGGPVRIGYAGSQFHKIDFVPQIINALLDTKKEYGSRVEFIFMGYMPDEFIGAATYIPFVKPEKYLETLRALRFDIGIIPCKMILFNDCRSDIKFLEYSLNRTATIASPVFPYMNTIKQGMGCLAENHRKKWRKALSRLIENREYAESMALNAHEYVMRNCLLKDKAGAYLNIFERIANLKPKEASIERTHN